MDLEKMKHYQALLENYSKDVRGTLKTIKENKTADQSMHYPTELSNYDNHPGEIGTELFQLELNNTIRIFEENLHKEIREAISRIHTGEYGVCQSCGQKIAEERLETIPYARLCIDCENSKHEKMESSRRIRPVEELILDAPLGRKYLNEQEDDEYEGLDYLNDLEKYGSADTPQDLGGYADFEEFYTNEVDRQGIVDPVDQISNEMYRRQLPD